MTNKEILEDILYKLEMDLKYFAQKELLGSISILENRIKMMKINLENKEYKGLNSLGEIQGLGSSIDNAIGKIRQLDSFIDLQKILFTKLENK